MEKSNFVKYDGGKLRYSLVPEGTMKEVLRVLEHGAAKYDDDNWQKCEEPVRYLNAAFRHLVFGLFEGEEYDEESGCHHAAHAVACLLFYMYLTRVPLAT